MTPLLDEYAQYFINDRLAEAQQAALAAQLPRRRRGAFAMATRARLAGSLRSLAARLEAAPIVDSRLVIARSR
jgi:hypothetical protein